MEENVKKELPDFESFHQQLVKTPINILQFEKRNDIETLRNFPIYRVGSDESVDIKDIFSNVVRSLGVYRETTPPEQVKPSLLFGPFCNWIDDNQKYLYETFLFSHNPIEVLPLKEMLIEIGTFIGTDDGFKMVSTNFPSPAEIKVAEREYEENGQKEYFARFRASKLADQEYMKRVGFSIVFIELVEQLMSNPLKERPKFGTEFTMEMYKVLGMSRKITELYRTILGKDNVFLELRNLIIKLRIEEFEEARKKQRVE